jgi:hypothetical protein
MGAQPCKCECDGDKENAAAAITTKPASSYEEEVVAPKVPVVSVIAPAEPASEPKARESRPPEQTGQEESPEPTEKKAATKQPEPKAGKAAPDGTRTLDFELEAGKALGARFAEIQEPSPRGTLVTTFINDSSALAKTKGGLWGLCAGDIITAVNGKAGGKNELLSLLQDAKAAGGCVSVTVKTRPAQFEAQLVKTGEEKMGVVVAVHDDIKSKVEVRQVSEEGAVPKFNENNHTNQVVAGDWVIAVNGTQKGANEMIQDMQEAWQQGKPLALRISTCPTEEARSKPKDECN